LTAREVEARRVAGLLADGGAVGLYFRITPTGSRSWVYRYMIEGRRRDLGLGPYPLVGLALARQRAVAARLQVLDRIDPLEVKAQTRRAARLAMARAMTFRQCGEAYIAAHRVEWKNPKHAAQWPATLNTYVYPICGDVPVQEIDVGLVIRALEPIWVSKPETAGRVRGRMESVLDWANARGYRQGENPARWRGHLENLLPKKSRVRAVAHHPALPYLEIGAFLAALRCHDGVAARALEFTILTAARTGEVIGARWEEIDIGARLWTVPAARMKAAREHRVPLSGAALALINALPRLGDYVFPGARAGSPLSNMALLMTLRRSGHPNLTTHGFRSTFRDWCAERTAFPSEVAEMALAHTVGDKVEAAYRRGDLFDKRRQLAEAWAAFCAQPIGADDIVSAGRRR
jgi:integrase